MDSDVKYETINILFNNGREDLLETFFNLINKNIDKNIIIDKNDIEELESIMAKNGKPYIIKFIKKFS